MRQKAPERSSSSGGFDRQGCPCLDVRTRWDSSVGVVEIQQPGRLPSGSNPSPTKAGGSEALVEQLSTQLELLEDKQFETFVREWVVLGDGQQGDDPAAIAMTAAMIGSQRGALITVYDQLLGVTSTATPEVLGSCRRHWQPARDSLAVSMGVLGGRWKLVFDARANQRGGRQPVQFMRAMEAARDPFGAR